MKNENKILAKDFMSMGFGIDILGLNHIGPRMRTEDWVRLREKRRENILRLFDKEDYAYVKYTENYLKSRLGVGDQNLKNQIKKV